MKLRLTSPPESGGIRFEFEQNGQRKLHPAQKIMKTVCPLQSTVERSKIVPALIVFKVIDPRQPVHCSQQLIS